MRQKPAAHMSGPDAGEPGRRSQTERRCLCFIPRRHGPRWMSKLQRAGGVLGRSMSPNSCGAALAMAVWICLGGTSRADSEAALAETPFSDKHRDHFLARRFRVQIALTSRIARLVTWRRRLWRDIFTA